MNKWSYGLLTCFMVGISAVLPACSDQQEVSAEKKAVVDELAPRYDSTLAEGIDFRRPGYPKFLANVSGISGHESWGRWTDANLGAGAGLRFKEPLPKALVLELQANGIGLNVGAMTKVRIGNIEKSLVVKNWPDQTIHGLSFDGIGRADTIEIIPPSPMNPSESNDKNADRRRLGLGLITLKIKSRD